MILNENEQQIKKEEICIKCLKLKGLKNKAEYPRIKPQLCIDCFLSYRKDKHKEKIQNLNFSLKELEENPHYFAQKYEEFIMEELSDDLKKIKIELDMFKNIKGKKAKENGNR